MKRNYLFFVFLIIQPIVVHSMNWNNLREPGSINNNYIVKNPSFYGAKVGEKTTIIYQNSHRDYSKGEPNCSFLKQAKNALLDGALDIFSGVPQQVIASVSAQVLTSFILDWANKRKNAEVMNLKELEQLARLSRHFSEMMSATPVSSPQHSEYKKKCEAINTKFEEVEQRIYSRLDH